MAENAANNAAPSLNALAQYCKDFSFENPNAPRSLQQQSEGPQINLQVNVNAKQLAEADFEVDLTLEGDAKIGGRDVLFAFELTYSGVFRVQNIPQRSEEHTSELQSRQYLVCRLLLEKKNNN